MSTQVFLQNLRGRACDQWGVGTAAWNPNSAFYSTGITGHEVLALGLDRPLAIGFTLNGSTVASSTARHRFQIGALAEHWVSPPLDRDVTIASTVTFNLWCLESSMSANIQMGCRVERILANGSLSATAVVAGATEGVEMNTSARAENFTATPTSTAFLKGDRLLITPYFTNIGTQGGGFTATLDITPSAVGADGESYITFTEDFGFLLDAPAATQYSQTDHSNPTTVGTSASNARTAFQFRSDWGQTVTQVALWLAKNGSPVDNLEVALQADASGEPSGTDLASASVVGSTLSASPGASSTFNIADTVLSAGTYWWVVRRSGSVDISNNYSVYDAGSIPGPRGERTKTFNSGGPTWSGFIDRGPYYVIDVTSPVSTTLYPTGTASEVDPNGASYDAKEVWTSRGAGATTAITNTAAAPASPLLATVASSGNFVEWFTKQLSAFTLGGAVLVNVRGLQSATTANSTWGVEIAVTNSSGASPVVWGYTLHGVELTLAEGGGPIQLFVSGDDVAVTDGQRIRVRVYIDDYNGAAMGASQTVTVYYAGTSGGASGDSYLTFGQTLLQQAAATPSSPPALHDFYRRNNLIRR